MKRWLAGEHDRRLLASLYRFGALSAQAVIQLGVPELGHYGYKRLLYLRKFGLVKALTYAEPVGKRKKLKRAAIYYLTDQGMKFVRDALGSEVGAPPRALPPADLELRYRMSVFLSHLCRDRAGLHIESARDIRRAYKLPGNVSLGLVVEGVALHFPRCEEGKIKKYQLNWLYNSIDRLQKQGIARHHIVVVRDREHRRKLAAAAVKNRPPLFTHILLPEQAVLVTEVKSIPGGLACALEGVWDRVEVQKSLAHVYKVPDFTVHTPVAPFYGADLTTFDLHQVMSVQSFCPRQAQKDGLAPVMVVAVQTEADIHDLVRLYASELVEHLRFAILNQPPECRFKRLVRGELIAVHPHLSRP